MHDMMKKQAAKQALEELIEQMMGIEGKMEDPDHAVEGMEPDDPNKMLVDEQAKEIHSGGKDSMDDEVDEKASFMKGMKKPMKAKSMMVMMKADVKPKMAMSKKMKGY